MNSKPFSFRTYGPMLLMLALTGVVINAKEVVLTQNTNPQAIATLQRGRSLVTVIKLGSIDTETNLPLYYIKGTNLLVPCSGGDAQEASARVISNGKTLSCLLTK